MSQINQSDSDTNQSMQDEPKEFRFEDTEIVLDSIKKERDVINKIKGLDEQKKIN